jgi:hypothetical protein
VSTSKGKSSSWSWLADGFLVFAFATVLVRPLYKAEYLDAWNSIESTFISDARFLSAHWPHPGWQPNWYLGTRTDYIYPPALRYGTAVLSRIRHTSTARSYHLYIALLYGFGITAVYVFVRTGSRSRWIALWAAAASAMVSPSFLFFKDFRVDYAGVQFMPIRLGVLVRYGEGPHMSAFALLPFALAAAWNGLRRGHPALLALTGVFAAAVVSNNFYGATALAIFFPILVWAVWLAEQDAAIFARAAVAAALAWGLCAFWFTPSYFRVTLDNMKLVSSPGHAWSAALLAAVVAAYGIVSYRLVRGRPERAWTAFCLGALAIMALNVIGNQYFDFRVMGEPGRLIPELDLVIFLALGVLFAWIAAHCKWGTAVAAALAVACLVPGKAYVQRAWKVIAPPARHEHRVEYVITDWIHRNLPGVRCLSTGSVRFWYNAWYDLPQLGGSSEQGLLNPNSQFANAEAVLDDDVDAGIAWLQATGVGAVIVHDKTSKEVYHDWPKPDRFEGKLEKIYNNEGDRIYRVPRRFEQLARVVDAAQIRAIAPSDSLLDYGLVRKYVDAVEHGPNSLVSLERRDTDEMRLDAQLQPGQLLLVQETYDPAWKAYVNGAAVPIARDAMHFLLIDAGTGDRDVLLRFETPLENRIGQVVFFLAVAAVAWLVWPRRVRHSTNPV